jgi:hypothetical protein
MRLSPHRLVIVSGCQHDDYLILRPGRHRIRIRSSLRIGAMIEDVDEWVFIVVADIVDEIVVFVGQAKLGLDTFKAFPSLSLI